MKALVTIEGESYGEIDLKPFFHGTALYEPEGAHYFCPDCGRVWASIKTPALSRHVVYTINCREHHHWQHWPGGTLWLGLHPELTSAFTGALLEYEFQRHCELYDQHQAPTA